MGLSWKGIKDYFTGNEADEYGDDIYEEEEGTDYEPVAPAPVATPTPASSFRSSKTGGYNSVATPPTAMTVVVVEPKVFEDSQNIVNHLREMRPVVINYENTDPQIAARIGDFVCGSTFALDGKLEKIGKDIFICVPMNITVDYSDTAYADLSDKLTWKEPQL